MKKPETSELNRNFSFTIQEPIKVKLKIQIQVPTKMFRNIFKIELTRDKGKNLNNIKYETKD